MREGRITVTKNKIYPTLFYYIQLYQCRTFDHLEERGEGLQVFPFAFVYIEITSRSQLGEIFKNFFEYLFENINT